MISRDPVVILLPPSEGKAAGGSLPLWQPELGRFGNELSSSRAALIDALVAVGGGDERLLGVGGKHLERAVAVNVNLLSAPTLPASARYTGVVMDALSPVTLPSSARQRATDTILIMSGLLGVVGFDDPIPDYRLKMGARLTPMGTLSRWWRPTLSQLLNDALRGTTVIDLLPGEHRDSWVPDRSLTVMRLAFVDVSGRAVGHDAKAAKGRFVRHVLTSRGGVERRVGSFADERFVVQVRT